MYDGDEESKSEDDDEDGGLVEAIAVFVSMLLILLTLPFSIWHCFQVDDFAFHFRMI